MNERVVTVAVLSNGSGNITDSVGKAFVTIPVICLYNCYEQLVAAKDSRRRRRWRVGREDTGHRSLSYTAANACTSTHQQRKCSHVTDTRAEDAEHPLGPSIAR
eukprot:GHVU01221781.1.p3 GENE.GHVU01221781.1~~GHVU01221781.1.p3  ORF type:complete len:104 (+),score=5.91 GHVU01221781.1:1107-1418(+)